MKKYVTYILYSPSHDKFYIGQTQHIEERLQRHNKGRSKYTSAFRPWQLLLSIEKESRSEALRLERKLKNLSKDRIRKFIEKYK